MRVYPEQLDQYLKTELKPCYLIFGEEPLLKMEAIDQIKTAAKKVGFDEHHKFHAEPLMDWPAVFHTCQSMSLFSVVKRSSLSSKNDQRKKISASLMMYLSC